MDLDIGLDLGFQLISSLGQFSYSIPGFIYRTLSLDFILVEIMADRSEVLSIKVKGNYYYYYWNINFKYMQKEENYGALLMNRLLYLLTQKKLQNGKQIMQTLHLDRVLLSLIFP